MKQKSKNNFNENIKEIFFFNSVAFFPIKWLWSAEFRVNSKWIQREFEVNFQWSEFEVSIEALNLVQDLVSSSLENNLINLQTLKRTTKKKIFYSSVSTFGVNKVGSIEEIGKLLSFSEIFSSVLIIYIFVFYFPCYFS